MKGSGVLLLALTLHVHLRIAPVEARRQVSAFNLDNLFSTSRSFVANNADPNKIAAAPQGKAVARPTGSGVSRSATRRIADLRTSSSGRRKLVGHAEIKTSSLNLPTRSSNRPRSQTISLGLTGKGDGVPFFGRILENQKQHQSSSSSRATSRGELTVAYMSPPKSGDKINIKDGRNKQEEVAQSDKVARVKTQSLSNPVSRDDRRAPTRVIAQPAANARGTMVLGGDKAPTGATSDSSGAKSSPLPSSLGGNFAFEDFQLPFTPAKVSLENGLKNDGPFAWMVPYVDLFGYRKGKTLVGAMPKDNESSSVTLSQEEMAARRVQAEEELTNISPEERERRAQAATVALQAAGAYAALSSLILDDGSFVGHLYRFAVLPFLFAWRGFDLSAKSGL